MLLYWVYSNIASNLQVMPCSHHPAVMLGLFICSSQPAGYAGHHYFTMFMLGLVIYSLLPADCALLITPQLLYWVIVYVTAKVVQPLQHAGWAMLIAPPLIQCGLGLQVTSNLQVVLCPWLLSYIILAISKMCYRFTAHRLGSVQ